MSLECPNCSEKFNDDENLIPKILKCGDTICIKCLKELSENEEITCPICSKKTNQKIEDTPTNKYAIQLRKSTFCDNCTNEYSNTFNGERIPKVLKCGDTFCLQCINSLSKNDIIICPFCKIESDVNVKDMPVNKLIIDSVGHSNININYLPDKKIEIKDLSYQYSIGLMGESNGGKTSISHYFHTGQPFEGRPLSTVGFDYHFKYITIDKDIVKVTLLDTAGQERFGSMSAGCLRGVHGLLLVFALTINPDDNLYFKWKSSNGEEKKEIEEEFTQKKFKTLEFWLEQFYQFNQQEKRIIYLIGNKVDDINNRDIQKKDAQKFAKEHELTYFETSAKTGENINNVFENLIIELIKLYPKKIERRGTKLKIKKHKKKYFC